MLLAIGQVRNAIGSCGITWLAILALQNIGNEQVDRKPILDNHNEMIALVNPMHWILNFEFWKDAFFFTQEVPVASNFSFCDLHIFI